MIVFDTGSEMKGFGVKILVVVASLGLVGAYVSNSIGKSRDDEKSPEDQVSSRHFDREKEEGGMIVPEENPTLLVPTLEKPARLIGPSDIDKMLEPDMLPSQEEEE